MMVKSITAAAALAVASFASGADAATIDFTTYGPASGSSLSFEGGLLTVSRVEVAGVGIGTVDVSANGLGRTTPDLGFFSINPDDTDELDDAETLVFSFSQEVVLKSLTFANFDATNRRWNPGDSYGVVVVLDGPDFEVDVSQDNPFYFGNLTSDLFTLTAGLSAEFYITELEYEYKQTPPDSDPGTPAVPLPAAGFLLVGALGGMAALRRKRS